MDDILENWEPIKTAPKTTEDILVGWWTGEKFWNSDFTEYTQPNKGEWVQCISAYRDLTDRRGFNHRNGPNKATHWHKLPPPPNT